MIIACIRCSVVPHSVVMQVLPDMTLIAEAHVGCVISVYGGGDPFCQVLHVSWVIWHTIILYNSISRGDIG